MQHQPNFAAALSVATHRNGTVAISPVPSALSYDPADILAMSKALNAGDVDAAIALMGLPVIDLDRSQWFPVEAVRC